MIEIIDLTGSDDDDLVPVQTPVAPPSAPRVPPRPPSAHRILPTAPRVPRPPPFRPSHATTTTSECLDHARGVDGPQSLTNVCEVESSRPPFGLALTITGSIHSETQKQVKSSNVHPLPYPPVMPKGEDPQPPTPPIVIDIREDSQTPPPSAIKSEDFQAPPAPAVNNENEDFHTPASSTIESRGDDLQPPTLSPSIFIGKDLNTPALPPPAKAKSELEILAPAAQPTIAPSLGPRDSPQVGTQMNTSPVSSTFSSIQPSPPPSAAPEPSKHDLAQSPGKGPPGEKYFGPFKLSSSSESETEKLRKPSFKHKRAVRRRYLATPPLYIQKGKEWVRRMYEGKQGIGDDGRRLYKLE